MERGKRWISLALAAVVGATLVASGEVRADEGALTQLPGIEGCISDDGSSTCRDARTLASTAAMSSSPDGRHVYVGLPSDRGIAVFARSRATGALVQLPGPDGCITESGNGGECAVGRGIRTVFGMAFSPDGKFAYTAAQFGHAIAAFARNKVTGVLTQLPGQDGCASDTGDNGCADGTALETLQSVAVSSDGKNVYATAAGPGAIVSFARNKTTGALTQLPGLQGCISHDGTGGLCTDGRGMKSAGVVAVSPDGRHVYSASPSHAIAVFSRNKTTGALTQLPGLAGCLRDSRLNDPECTPVREIGYAGAIRISEDGKFVYVAGSGDAIAIFSRNKSSGELTQLPGALGCVNSTGDGSCTYASQLFTIVGLAMSPNGRQVYATGAAANAVAVLERNPTTGTLTQLPGDEGCIALHGNDGLCTEGRAMQYPLRVEVSPDGRHVYTTSSWSKAVAVFQRER